jgi:hypothetical protein
MPPAGGATAAPAAIPPAATHANVAAADEGGREGMLPFARLRISFVGLRITES